MPLFKVTWKSVVGFYAVFDADDADQARDALPHQIEECLEFTGECETIEGSISVCPAEEDRPHPAWEIVK